MKLKAPHRPEYSKITRVNGLMIAVMGVLILFLGIEPTTYAMLSGGVCILVGIGAFLCATRYERWVVSRPVRAPSRTAYRLWNGLWGAVVLGGMLLAFCGFFEWGMFLVVAGVIAVGRAVFRHYRGEW